MQMPEALSAQQPVNRRAGPRSLNLRLMTAFVERRGDGAKRLPPQPKFPYHRHQVFIGVSRSLPIRDGRSQLALSSRLGRQLMIAMENDPARPPFRHARADPKRRHARLVLGHHREYLDAHAVRMRVVHANELDASVEQLRRHEDAAREPIQARDTRTARDRRA